MNFSRHLNQRDRLTLTVDSTGCQNQPSNKVVYLEHVHAVLDMGASKRGEIEVGNIQCTIVFGIHRPLGLAGYLPRC